MNKIKPQTLKGFRDFLPKEAKKRQWLREKLEKIFELWGFDPLETPTLEPLEIFQGQIGDDEKMFYKFKDQGGRNVALRYDQTVPSVRVVSQYKNELPKPFRRYQIQPAFRSENPQKGRYREFIQCDADIFGDPSPYADAEVIALSLDIYCRLNFPKAKVLINDRDLMTDFPYEALVCIDKVKKIGEKEVLEEMKTRGISRAQAEKYLSTVKSLKPSKTINIILDYLNSYGFAKDWYEFDPTITRSFAYSQGPIWEVVIPGFTAGSVLGGEREDKLFKDIFGLEGYGTGFGLGFDRTLEAAEQYSLVPDIKTSTKVLVTVFGLEQFEESLAVTKILRANDINSEIYSDPSEKLDKQLKYADKKGISYVVIIGPDEAKNKTVTLKNLTQKTQKTIPQSTLLKELKL